MGSRVLGGGNMRLCPCGRVCMCIGVSVDVDASAVMGIGGYKCE